MEKLPMKKAADNFKGFFSCAGFSQSILLAHTRLMTQSFYFELGMKPFTQRGRSFTMTNFGQSK
jgi:hypothetical protein